MACRTVRLVGALVAAAAIVTSCSDSTTTPQLASATGTANLAAKPLAKGKSSGTVVSNSVKYSDKGIQPSTVVSKGVTVSSRAYTLRNGTAMIDVVAGTFDAPITARGKLYKIEYTVYNPAGKRVAMLRSGQDVETNDSGAGLVSKAIPGVGKNFRVDVQVMASGTDSPRRAPNMALQNVVSFAPDLAVTNIEVPSHVHAFEVTPITATVRERAGDVGGRADCVLLGDNVELDRAPSVWVDAGGTVTCAFMPRFTKLKSVHLTVALANTSIPDFDTGNNTASLDITVEKVVATNQTVDAGTTAEVPLTYTAEAGQHVGQYINNYTYQYDDDPVLGFGYHDYWALNYSQNDMNQYARILGSAQQAIAFPIAHIELSQHTGSALVDARSYDNVAATSTFGTAADGGACVQDGDAGFTYIVCTYFRHGDQWSTVYYQHYAGTVTYVSAQMTAYTAPWGSASSQSGYYRNDSGWGTVVPFGNNVAFDVKVTSGGYSFTASPNVTLGEYAYTTLDTPCTRVPGPYGSARECYFIKGDYVDKGGSVSGPIVP